MNRGSSRLYLLIAVALTIFCVGAAARAGIPSETDPSRHPDGDIRIFNMEWCFATAWHFYPDLYANNIVSPVILTPPTVALLTEVQQSALTIVAPLDISCLGDFSAAHV